MKELVRVVDLCVSIGDRFLYKNLNLVINEGDQFIYMGPNGVGKSLLLELISIGESGYLHDNYKGLHVSGQILDSDGNDLLNPRTDRCIAYAHQEEDFYENTTVLKEIETVCNGSGIPLDMEKLDKLLDAFSLKDKKTRRVKNSLSFGEGKIVHLISVVLKLSKCNVLILDEPLNHLSFKNSQTFNRIINDEITRNPKLAILMVSHCRAMSFTDKALLYDSDRRNLSIHPYTSYNCFNDAIGCSLGCVDS